MTGGMRKKQLMTSFLKHLTKKKKKKKMLYASALSQKGALKRISTIQGYIQGPLRKKQLIGLYRK